MADSSPGTRHTSTLITGGVVVTVNPTNEIFDPGFVLVEGNRIAAVGPSSASPANHGGRIIDAHNRLVMPGLINVHTHAAMALLRGLADDLPLKTWLEEQIFPIESRFVTPDFVHAGTLLAGVEMIRSGTTCFCDGYFFEASALNAVDQLGLRAVMGQGILDVPAPDAPDPSLALEHAEDFLTAAAAAPERITPALFCHAAYTCSPATLSAASALCRERGVLLLMHAAETATEVSEVARLYGRSPLRHLNALGLLDYPAVLMHCVWVDADEYSLLARDTVGVAHCPESNMKLASGVAPVPDYLERGIAVGLGTDGCASNNNLDLFAEMDTAAKIHKVKQCDPAVMSACDVLRLATIGGARALGLDREVGSLEPGKQADVIILDWNQPHLTPVYDYCSHLVYAASGHDVLSVMVNGNLLMENRTVLTVDEHVILEEAKRIGNEVRNFQAARRR